MFDLPDPSDSLLYVYLISGGLMVFLVSGLFVRPLTEFLRNFRDFMRLNQNKHQPPQNFVLGVSFSERERIGEETEAKAESKEELKSGRKRTKQKDEAAYRKDNITAGS